MRDAERVAPRQPDVEQLRRHLRNSLMIFALTLGAMIFMTQSLQEDWGLLMAAGLVVAVAGAAWAATENLASYGDVPSSRGSRSPSTWVLAVALTLCALALEMWVGIHVELSRRLLFATFAGLLGIGFSLVMTIRLWSAVGKAQP